jgi:hypothetical protein
MTRLAELVRELALDRVIFMGKSDHGKGQKTGILQLVAHVMRFPTFVDLREGGAELGDLGLKRDGDLFARYFLNAFLIVGVPELLEVANKANERSKVISDNYSCRSTTIRFAESGAC